MILNIVGLSIVGSLWLYSGYQFIRVVEDEEDEEDDRG
jgi:membrane protein DedA with SNARE-associated domain